MASPHIIRLRGPWEFEALGPAPAGFARGRIKLPVDESPLPSAYAGRVRYSRRFQQPSGLEPAERVWLVVTARAAGAATLNGRRLGDLKAEQPAEFDVTDDLTHRNLLSLDLEKHPPRDVRLEIREQVARKATVV